MAKLSEKQGPKWLKELKVGTYTINDIVKITGLKYNTIKEQMIRYEVMSEKRYSLNKNESPTKFYYWEGYKGDNK